MRPAPQRSAICAMPQVAALFLATAAAGAQQCPPGSIPWPAAAGAVSCEAKADSAAKAKEFLRANAPPWDVDNAGTLFDGGIVDPTVDISLQARVKFPWAALVPRDIWEDGVLPYASVNEARSNWRALLWTLVPGLVANATSLEEAALSINRGLWTLLGQKMGHDAIKFKSEQTPLVYDPMSTLAFGYASCTGISLLYVDALRTVGIPARLAGTPAWHGNASNGNHNWVEVWLSSAAGWRFIEGQPAGSGETFSNVCDKWFCNAAHFADGLTQVFATAFRRSTTTGAHYPMAWDMHNTGIPGVDQTAYYHSACAKC
eukprot:TRINITY_DN25774_c0_g1_i1.p2 TRINITY_DN25774_c0_g1~~TRINITY_DN25774_c0_g1_i1.p2  ORF type:complete len:316 (+),score=60.95 TRINITY_DN25774_c0_g1_i1:88-1035(+)